MLISDFMRNLRKLYKPSVTDDQEGFYVAFLNRFEFFDLDIIWSRVMEDHTKSSPPTIGELKRYASGIPRKKEKVEGITEFSEEKIFKTRLGRYSLSQGWANSYLIYCEREYQKKMKALQEKKEYSNEDFTKQTDTLLMEFQKNHQKFRDEKLELEEILERPLTDDDLKVDYKTTRLLLGLANTMEKRSKDLTEKYKHLITTM